MKKLRVELGELAFAFENASWEMSHYLDLETGQVITITSETRRELEGIYEEIHDPESDQSVDLAEVLEEYDIPDWRKETLLEADRLEAGYGTRYISVPRAESYEGYRDMEDFIITVRDERLQDRLWRAISGRGAFRRFKDVLLSYPRERERWFEFKDDRLQGRVFDWLESEGIEPIIEPAPVQESYPPPPPVRARLIAEVLIFARGLSTARCDPYRPHRLAGYRRARSKGRRPAGDGDRRHGSDPASCRATPRALPGAVTSSWPILRGTTWGVPAPGSGAAQAFACDVMRCTAGGGSICTTTGKRFACPKA